MPPLVVDCFRPRLAPQGANPCLQPETKKLRQPAGERSPGTAEALWFEREGLTLQKALAEAELLDQAGTLTPLVDGVEDVADIYADGAL